MRHTHISRKGLALAQMLLRCLLVWICLNPSLHARAERIKDIATLQGMRDNPLVGYGLVVGLDGSGDQVRQSPFTQQSLVNMLSQLGITLTPGSNMQIRNVAAVMVTATLPAFARPGQTIDVAVSSLGNARSLRGGTLLMTPLKGANGETYAIAQGSLLVGGMGAEAGGASMQVNHLNAGIIPAGAIVERAVPVELVHDGQLRLELDTSDASVLQAVLNTINRRFGTGTASPGEGRVVLLKAPADAGARAAFMAQIENLTLTLPAPRARVVVNARTGSVAMNRSVTLDEAAVAFGSLSVVIGRQVQISQPDTAFAGGQTVMMQDATVDVTSKPGAVQHINGGAKLSDVVRALNALGATPQELLSILQNLKRAGALRAELEVI